MSCFYDLDRVFPVHGTRGITRGVLGVTKKHFTGVEILVLVHVVLVFTENCACIELKPEFISTH